MRPSNVLFASGSTTTPRPRRSRRKPVQEQRFSSYLSFGSRTTVCLGGFLILYIVVFLSLQPLLSSTSPSPPSSSQLVAEPGKIRKRVTSAVHDRLAQGGEMAFQLKKQFMDLRKGKGVTDEVLMKAAAQEFKLLRNKIQDIPKPAVVVDDKVQVQDGRTGFIVLGMHRSGTSMLSGLLVTAAGYNVGGPLIGAHFDNEKGFFERIDVVLQNDEFMGAQNMGWSAGVINYDFQKALDDKEAGRITFKEGAKGLAFFNDPSNAPWLQKDPRMCITLKTWLKLLNHEPAIVFTYRHPLEVAMSLKKREKGFSIEHGLRLWIVYNMRAIQNSAGLCKVLSSNEAILDNPLDEVQRIADDLTSKCGLPAAPHRVTQDDVDKFVDPSLQHNKKQRELEAKEKKIMKTFDGDCEAPEYESDYAEGTQDRERETGLYLKAMQIYCDFKSGKAYEADYAWPQLA